MQELTVMKLRGHSKRVFGLCRPRVPRFGWPEARPMLPDASSVEVQSEAACT